MTNTAGVVSLFRLTQGALQVQSEAISRAVGSPTASVQDIVVDHAASGGPLTLTLSPVGGEGKFELPPDKGGAPGEAAADRGEADQIAYFDLAFTHRGIQRQRQRR